MATPTIEGHMSNRILIDWLRATFADLTVLDEFVDIFGVVPTAATPAGFYNSAVVLSAQGVRVGDVAWHTEQPRQRVQFTFTGHDLDRWRTADQIGALMAFVVNHNGRFTRIDVAIDVLDVPSANVAGLAEEAEQGHMTTHATTHSVIRSTRDGIEGITLYIGNRQSDKFVRIYDKAAEQGISAQWVRIELEAKGDYARALGPRLAEEGMDLARKEIDRFVSFDAPWWLGSVSIGANFERIDVDRSRGNREKWQTTALLTMVKDAITENQEFAAMLVNFLRQTGLIDKRSD